MAYDTEDIGITEIDGKVDNWLNTVNSTKNPNTKIVIIEGASHGFRGYDTILAEQVGDFTNQMLAIFA